MIPNNNNFVLDVARDVSHGVPNRGNLLVDYRRSGRDRVEVGSWFTLVDEPDYSVVSLDFFE